MTVARVLVPHSPAQLGGPAETVLTSDFHVVVQLGRVVLVRFQPTPKGIDWFTSSDLMHCALQHDATTAKVIRNAAIEQQLLYGKAPCIQGVRVLSGRDSTYSLSFSFALDAPGDHGVLERLVGALGPGHEVRLPGPPGRDETSLRVRHTRTGLEIATSRHGSLGSWESCSAEQAVSFLARARPALDGRDPWLVGSFDVPSEPQEGPSHGVPKQGMTIKAQLAALERAGIGLAPGTSVRSIAEHCEPDGDLRQLLCELGNDTEDDSGGDRPQSHDIWHGDAECIDGEGDYIALAQRLALMAGGALPLEALADHIGDDGAWLSFSLDGKDYQWRLELNSDWVDSSLFSRFAQLLADRNAGRKFTYMDLGGQDFLIGCANEEQLRMLNALPGLAFRWLN